MNERKFASSAYYRGTGKVIVDSFTGQMVKYARNEAELWCNENDIHKKHRIDAKIEAWCLYVRGKNIKKTLSRWWQEHRKRELFELERGLSA